jgi:hypothetical protein
MKKTDKNASDANNKNKITGEEDSVDKLFNEAKDGKINKVLRKNKILSYLKIILISLVVTVAVLYIAYLVVDTFSFDYCQSKWLAAANRLGDYYRIKYPDRHIGEFYSYYNGMFRGSLEYTTYKNLDGRILYSGTEKRVFGFINMCTGITGDGMICQQTDDDYINVDFRYRPGSVYGLRYMTFFYPDVEYKNGINDMELLIQIPDDKIVEIGISFDREYPLSEARMLIPENLVTFYWVDNKNSGEKTQQACGENEIYGIKLLDENGKTVEEPATDFINALTQLKNTTDDSRIDIYISGDSPANFYAKIAGSDSILDESDLYVLGAVLVGNPDNIARLKDRPFIRYATLGSVVDKY